MFIALVVKRFSTSSGKENKTKVGTSSEIFEALSKEIDLLRRGGEIVLISLISETSTITARGNLCYAIDRADLLFILKKVYFEQGYFRCQLSLSCLPGELG